MQDEEQERRGINKQTWRLIAVFVGVLAVSALLSYLLFGRDGNRATDNTPAPPAASIEAPNEAATAGASNQTAPPQTPARDGSAASVVTEIFGAQNRTPLPDHSDNLGVMALRITLKFALAALLASVLAFRPRQRRPGLLQRSPYVAQTQILLAIVASALMLVVGDSAARAFGIFAAASLVRFRTNISDPKEITVLLISLGIGLATGVGHWEVAIVLCLFSLAALYILEYYEPAQAFRAMELTVATRRVEETNRIIRRVLRKHSLNIELRELNREDPDDPMGKIVYHVNVSLLTSTDQLSSEIFSLDEQNIDSIAWGQKKTPSIYSG